MQKKAKANVKPIYISKKKGKKPKSNRTQKYQYTLIQGKNAWRNKAEESKKKKRAEESNKNTVIISHSNTTKRTYSEIHF